MKNSYNNSFQCDVKCSLVKKDKNEDITELGKIDDYLSIDSFVIESILQKNNMKISEEIFIYSERDKNTIKKASDYYINNK